MKGKATLLTYFVLLILFSATFAQSGRTVPNLSGTWRLTQSKNAPKLPNGTEITRTIVHEDPQISVTIHMKSNDRQDTLKQVFFSDGRGETNPTFGAQMLQSQSKWNGNKLEVRSTDTVSIKTPTGETKIVKLRGVQKWGLSKDQNTLTITTNVSGPPGVTTKNAFGDGPATDIFSRVQ